MILNHNRLLYPFHKWLLKETEKAEHKPEKFMANNSKATEKQKRQIIGKNLFRLDEHETLRFR